MQMPQVYREQINIGGIATTEKGTFDSYYHDSPWHPSTGIVVDKAMTLEELKDFDILKWTVSKLEVPDPRNSKGSGYYGIYKDVAPENQSRKDLFGYVGKNYEPFQNSEVLEVAAKLAGNASNAYVSSMGALENGRCFASVYLPDHMIVVKGDRTHSYLNVIWGHGGTASIVIGYGGYRMECYNMVASNYQIIMDLAENGEDGARRFRHSLKVRDNIERFLKSADETIAGIKTLEARLNFLSEKEVNSEYLAETLNKVFALKARKGTDTLTKQAQALIEKITNIFETNANNLSAELKHKRYGLFQTLTNYFNHEANTRMSAEAIAESGAEDEMTARKMRREQNILLPSGTSYGKIQTALSILSR